MTLIQPASEWLSYFLPLQGAPVKVPFLLSSNWPNQCQWGDQKRVSLRLEWPWQTRMRPRYTNTVQLYMDMVGICGVLVEFQEERDILHCMKVNHTPKNNCPFKRFNKDSKIVLKIKKKFIQPQTYRYQVFGWCCYNQLSYAVRQKVCRKYTI